MDEKTAAAEAGTDDPEAPTAAKQGIAVRQQLLLQVGATSETVEVVATSPMLESSNASIGQVIESQAISDLPLNGRNYLDLAKLSMGVVEPSGNDQPGSDYTTSMYARLRAIAVDWGTPGGALSGDPVVLDRIKSALELIYTSQYNENVGEIGNHGWELEGSTGISRLTASGTLSFVDSRVRKLARRAAQAYADLRAELGYPLIRDEAERAKWLQPAP